MVSRVLSWDRRSRLAVRAETQALQGRAAAVMRPPEPLFLASATCKDKVPPPAASAVLPVSEPGRGAMPKHLRRSSEASPVRLLTALQRAVLAVTSPRLVLLGQAGTRPRLRAR